MAGELITTMGLSVAYVIVGGIVGMAMMLFASYAVPRIMGKMTPNIDEEKEIIRGNLAVATYYGQITQGVIIAIGIIIAAAIISGIL